MSYFRQFNQMKVTGCFSATGQAITPLIVFDSTSLNKERMKDQVPGTTHGYLRAKGQVDTVLFEEWLTDYVCLTLQLHTCSIIPRPYSHKEKGLLNFG